MFALLSGAARPPCAACARASVLKLVRDDLSPNFATSFDRETFAVGTVEPQDLPSCVAVLMDGFYKDVLTLAADEFSKEEMEVVTPVLSQFNGGLKWLTRILLSYEAGKRLAAKLPTGGYERHIRPGDGLMIAVQHRNTKAIVGVVEVSEQPCDGKVPGDVRLPTLPFISMPPNVAYVSNLAVLSEWRGRGLGSSLLEACEGVVASTWNLNEVYLHAATGQERLLSYYRERGYEQLPDMDQPTWVLAISGREPTRYHRKGLR